MGWRSVLRRPLVREASALAQEVGDTTRVVRPSLLASAIAFAAFLSLFPLAVLAVALIGTLTRDNGDQFVDQLIQFMNIDGTDLEPLVRDALTSAASSAAVTSLVGLALLLWAGLFLTTTVQSALNQIWGTIDRTGFRARLLGLTWLIIAGASLVASIAVTAALALLPAVIATPAVVAGFAINVCLWIVTTKMLVNAPVEARSLIPGALVFAVCQEVLRVVSALVVPKMITSSSEIYGALGVIFAMLGWLLVFSRVVVYTAMFDARRYLIAAAVERVRQSGSSGSVVGEPPDIVAGGDREAALDTAAQTPQARAGGSDTSPRHERFDAATVAPGRPGPPRQPVAPTGGDRPQAEQEGDTSVLR